MLAGRDGSVVGLASGTHGLGQGSTMRRCWSHRRGGETPPSPVTPTYPTGYAAKGASPALPLLDDAHGHRRRRGALDLRPWRRNQTHHTSITTCWGIVNEAQRRYRPQLPICPEDGDATPIVDESQRRDCPHIGPAFRVAAGPDASGVGTPRRCLLHRRRRASWDPPRSRSPQYATDF